MNIKYVSDRFFIDITKSGCGSACSYCYVKSSREEQVLISEADLLKSLNSIINSSCFVCGIRGSMISLCPNTEPFKCDSSIYLIVCIINFFLPLGNPLQISTKETIPLSILQLAQNLSLYDKQVFFYISSSCVTMVDSVEPFASKIDQRFMNFKYIESYSKLTSCLYIKPFTYNTFSDLDIYVDLVKQYKPDIVCVGIDFKKNTVCDNPCDMLYQNREVVNSVIGTAEKDNILFFSKEIASRTSLKVFHSSVCVINYFNKAYTYTNLQTSAPFLCVKCNGCFSNKIEGELL